MASDDKWKLRVYKDRPYFRPELALLASLLSRSLTAAALFFQPLGFFFAFYTRSAAVDRIGWNQVTCYWLWQGVSSPPPTRFVWSIDFLLWYKAGCSGSHFSSNLDLSILAQMDKDMLKKQIENMKFQATMERWPLSKSIAAWVLVC